MVPLLLLIALVPLAPQDPAGQQRLLALLQKNREAVDLEGAGPRFQFLDTSDKEIFLLGESHGMAITHELDLAMLRHLHRTAGVRVYLAELGYALTAAINRYSENGDEKLLDSLMADFRGSPAWTKEYRASLVNFRNFNQSLPKAERVRMVGVDIEHQTAVALGFLADAVRGKTAPEPIRDIVARLGSASRPGVEKFAPELLASLAAHRAEYAAMLGDNLFEFELVATNLQKRNECYGGKGDGTFDKLRERVMYDTYLKLRPRLAGAKCYGSWGSAHVAQSKMDGVERFATLLNGPDSPVAKKVLSIFTLHQDAEALVFVGGSYRALPQPSRREWVRGFEPFALGKVTLFKLAGTGEPEKFGQYVLLVKGARASHPLEEQKLPPAGPPPVVVKTYPESGAKDVPPGPTELRVTFSTEMLPGSWSFVPAAEGEMPKGTGQPRYEADQRTCVHKLLLEPGKTYALWLNSERSNSFRDMAGRPATPYLLVFRTGALPAR